METKTIIIQFQLINNNGTYKTEINQNKLTAIESKIISSFSMMNCGEVVSTQVRDRTFEIFISKVNNIALYYDLIFSTLKDCDYDFKIGWVGDNILDTLQSGIEYPLKGNTLYLINNPELYNFWTY